MHSKEGYDEKLAADRDAVGVAVNVGSSAYAHTVQEGEQSRITA